MKKLEKSIDRTKSEFKSVIFFEYCCKNTRLLVYFSDKDEFSRFIEWVDEEIRDDKGNWWRIEDCYWGSSKAVLALKE